MKSVFNINYNGRNITQSLDQYVTGISYTDNVSGVSDELSLDLEDKDERWSNEWYPDKGADIDISFGYEPGDIVKINTLQIDEITIRGSKQDGEVVSLKAISKAITKQLHTKRSRGHENKTLSEIVNTYAAKYGLTVVGKIENITIGRVSQYREKDITFLHRLADEYGYVFSIKGNKMIFHHLQTLEGLPHVATIDKGDCISWDIRDKSLHIYNAATVQSHHPKQNKVVKSTYTIDQLPNKDGVNFDYIKQSNDTLNIKTKTENEGQANSKANAALYKANSVQQTGNIELPGNPLYVAGVNIELTGFGKNSGIWNVLKAVHKKTKNDDYKTGLEVKKVVAGTVSGSAAKTSGKLVKNSPYIVKSIKNKDGIPFNIIETK